MVNPINNGKLREISDKVRVLTNSVNNTQNFSLKSDKIFGTGSLVTPIHFMPAFFQNPTDATQFKYQIFDARTFQVAYNPLETLPGNMLSEMQSRTSVNGPIIVAAQLQQGAPTPGAYLYVKHYSGSDFATVATYDQLISSPLSTVTPYMRALAQEGVDQIPSSDTHYNFVYTRDTSGNYSFVMLKSDMTVTQPAIPLFTIDPTKNIAGPVLTMWHNTQGIVPAIIAKLTDTNIAIYGYNVIPDSAVQELTGITHPLVLPGTPGGFKDGPVSATCNISFPNLPQEAYVIVQKQTGAFTHEIRLVTIPVNPSGASLVGRCGDDLIIASDTTMMTVNEQAGEDVLFLTNNNDYSPSAPKGLLVIPLQAINPSTHTSKILLYDISAKEVVDIYDLGAPGHVRLSEDGSRIWVLHQELLGSTSHVYLRTFETCSHIAPTGSAHPVVQDVPPVHPVLQDTIYGSTDFTAQQTASVMYGDGEETWPYLASDSKYLLSETQTTMPPTNAGFANVPPASFNLSNNGGLKKVYSWLNSTVFVNIKTGADFAGPGVQGPLGNVNTISFLPNYAKITYTGLLEPIVEDSITGNQNNTTTPNVTVFLVPSIPVGLDAFLSESILSTSVITSQNYQPTIDGIVTTSFVLNNTPGLHTVYIYLQDQICGQVIRASGNITLGATGSVLTFTHVFRKGNNFFAPAIQLNRTTRFGDFMRDASDFILHQDSQFNTLKVTGANIVGLTPSDPNWNDNGINPPIDGARSYVLNISAPLQSNIRTISFTGTAL